VPSSPDAPTGVAKGLASLMGDDPCVARYGPKAKECAGRDLAKKTGPMDSLLPTTKEEQARNYAAFMEKCPNWVGCEGGEWRSDQRRTQRLWHAQRWRRGKPWRHQ